MRKAQLEVDRGPLSVFLGVTLLGIGSLEK
jgi:hypothetical protein